MGSSTETGSAATRSTEARPGRQAAPTDDRLSWPDPGIQAQQHARSVVGTNTNQQGSRDSYNNNPRRQQGNRWGIARGKCRETPAPTKSNKSSGSVTDVPTHITENPQQTPELPPGWGLSATYQTFSGQPSPVLSGHMLSPAEIASRGFGRIVPETPQRGQARVEGTGSARPSRRHRTSRMVSPPRPPPAPLDRETQGQDAAQQKTPTVDVEPAPLSMDRVQAFLQTVTPEQWELLGGCVLT